jgi:hypothetical protein
MLYLHNFGLALRWEWRASRDDRNTFRSTLCWTRAPRTTRRIGTMVKVSENCHNSRYPLAPQQALPIGYRLSAIGYRLSPISLSPLAYSKAESMSSRARLRCNRGRTVVRARHILFHQRNRLGGAPAGDEVPITVILEGRLFDFAAFDGDRGNGCGSGNPAAD